MTNIDSILKSRDITLAAKVHLVKAMVFPMVIYGCELDYKESWTSKNWCFWTVVLEKTLESPLDYREVQPVHPKRDQSWVFIGRSDAEAETPVLRPPDEKSWLIGQDPGAGKDWGQEEKGTTEDEMVGWHHRLDGHGFVWTLGVGDGQGDLACCGSWGCIESNRTEHLNWTDMFQESCWVLDIHYFIEYSQWACDTHIFLKRWNSLSLRKLNELPKVTMWAEKQSGCPVSYLPVASVQGDCYFLIC